MKQRLITAGLAGILSLALVGCDDPDNGLDSDLDGDTMITQTTIMPPATVTPTTGTG